MRNGYKKYINNYYIGASLEENLPLFIYSKNVLNILFCSLTFLTYNDNNHWRNHEADVDDGCDGEHPAADHHQEIMSAIYFIYFEFL